MTIEHAIGLSASDLEAMTPELLEKHFAHYLPSTRPELQPKSVNREQKILELNPAFARAQKLAKSVGINIPTYLGLKTKKK